MIQDQEKAITDLQRRVSELENRKRVIDHFHTGQDASRVYWKDVNQKILFVHHTIVGAAAATAANYGVFFIAPAYFELISAREVHQTAGTDVGAVTLDLEKLTGTQALDAGVSMLASTINLKGAVNTVVSGTLSATLSNRNLATGDRIAMKDAGTLTSVANVTIELELRIVQNS